MTTDRWNDIRPLEQACASRAGLFQPLDPEILSAAIPTFFVGRDRDGFWLIRDVKGETGGIFLLKSSALAFARKLAGPVGCATIFSAERFELDLENHGNPLIGPLKTVLHFAVSLGRWIFGRLNMEKGTRSSHAPCRRSP